MNVKAKRKLSSFQIILLGFLVVILLGAILLTLPISSKSREFTSFIDSLFTSTSAVCVTGLVVFDTAMHWSVFGQIIILLLIQIGGMGVVVLTSSLALLSGKKIGLLERNTIQESMAVPTMGGILKLTSFAIKGVFLIELVGALLLMPVFCVDFGAKGVWLAIFHAVSAFCNAGFDLMGAHSGEFSSLTGYSAQPMVNVVVMLLIVIGGLGFLTWNDICVHKWRINKYRLQSKVVLTVTGLLILIPALYMFFFEFSDMPFGQRLLVSLFSAITPRTAGFNTVDLNLLSQVGLTITIFLMVVGGSPGSTAGGMKTTTLAVLFASGFSVFRKKDSVQMGKRRINDDVIRHAITIFMMYLILFLLCGIIICKIENLPLSTCLFETASAIGTVGLSLGITPSLGIASKLILILLMFFGRVGGLNLIYATLGTAKNNLSKLPEEKIMVG